ncbi:vitamin K-dependent gamma-carboxylase family protein [Mycobacterium xenopi 4042]|uniref:Vitamin K-dependent gamma-carboxylase family protein n=1 Tax=Mycobacterium xenopi 4042 TaxID=1299334 RepID=X8CAD6_MYCXE|nr:vitamin K-dependent gamma-carboxylase family protein [Mycobacterium xenopi 4042]
MTIGWHSRLAALVVFVLIVSFEHRNPWVWNSGDIVVRLEALFLALSPCGAALSLDQKRAGATFWSAQQRPQWPVRLMQLQLSLIYLASVLSKINGSAWPQGTAVSYALRLQDMLLVRAPDWLTNSALLMNIATWGSLGVELSLAILVWNRRLRPWVWPRGGHAHVDHDHHRRWLFHPGDVRALSRICAARDRAAASPQHQRRRDEDGGDAYSPATKQSPMGGERGSDAAAEGCREGSSADPA